MIKKGRVILTALFAFFGIALMVAPMAIQPIYMIVNADDDAKKAEENEEKNKSALDDALENEFGEEDNNKEDTKDAEGSDKKSQGSHTPEGWERHFTKKGYIFKRPKKDNSIYYLAEQIFVPGSYVNEVWKAVTYGDKENADNTVWEDRTDGKEICNFPDEPQNLLNHNCDIPQMGTEFFQVFLGPASTKGVQNYQMTSSMITGLSLGMPVGIPNNKVPATKKERVASGYNYTALERFGYNLELTSYAGEYDEISTSTPARLLANIGFWGKLKLGGMSLLNGLGAMWDSLVSNLEWNPLKWGKKIFDSFVDGTAAAGQTVVDTSNLNIAATHGWKRPDFVDTLYNVYYATDKQIIEKQNDDLMQKIKNELKGKIEEDVNAKKAIHLMPEEADFPKFTYDPKKLTKDSESKIKAWKSCTATSKSNNSSQGNNCGSEPTPVYMTEEEEFDEWKKEDYQVKFDKDAKDAGIDCFDESKNYSQLLECYKPKFTDYGKDIFSGDKAVFKNAVQKIMDEYFKDNPHYDVNRGIAHYMCGDEEGAISDGSKSEASWKWVYDKENTRTGEFLNSDSNCRPVRPSIEGAQYGTGDGESTDTRYGEFVTKEPIASVGFWGGLGKWVAQLTAKITNSLISLSFSNIIEMLGIDKVISSSLETFRDSVFFPLATIAIAIWGTWSIVKYQSVKGYGFLKMLLEMLLVFCLATFTLFQAGNLLKVVEIVPTEFDKLLAEALITDETTPYCKSSGGQDKVRNIQCTVWDVTIFQPWVHAQWGTSYSNLNSNKFSISADTKALVGDAETDLGAKKIKNWALYQLDRTKTGSITTADKSHPTGFKAKNIYKIVDLQAGPKNGKGRDAKYLHSWAGHNSERGSIMFLSGAIGVLTLVVVGGLAIAKLDMTFQMALRIFFLPFVFVIGLLPGGTQKTWQYLGDILGLIMKRIFVVLLLIVTLNILNAIANSDSNYVVTAMFSISILIGIKMYWKEIVRLINETDVNINQARDTIMNGVSSAMPKSVKQRYAQAKTSLYSGASMALGGAISGAIIDRQLKKEGLEVKGSGAIEGMKHGWQMGAGRGALLSYNRNRRRGFGLGETLLQAYNVGKVEGDISKVMAKSNPKLMADLFTIKGILTNKIYSIKSEMRKTEEYLIKELESNRESTSQKNINKILKNDKTYNELSLNLGNLERAVGVIDNMTDKKAGKAGSTAGLKAHQLQSINKLFMNLNMDNLNKGIGLNDKNIDNSLRNLFKGDFDNFNRHPNTDDKTVAALNFANLINSNLKVAAEKELNFDKTFYGKIHNIMIGDFRRDKHLMRHKINRIKYNILSKKLEAQETLNKLFERKHNAKNGEELSKYAEFMRLYNEEIGGNDKQIKLIAKLTREFMENTNPKEMFGTNLIINEETGKAMPAVLINPVTGKEFPMRGGKYYDPQTGQPMTPQAMSEYYFENLAEPLETNKINYNGPYKEAALSIYQLQKYGVDPQTYNEILMGKGGIKAASAYAIAEIYNQNEKWLINKPKEVVELEKAANKKSGLSEVGELLMGAFFEQKPAPNETKDPKKRTKANLFEDPTTALSRLSGSADRINKVESLSDPLSVISSNGPKLRGLEDNGKEIQSEKDKMINNKRPKIPGVVLSDGEEQVDKAPKVETYKVFDNLKNKYLLAKEPKVLSGSGEKTFKFIRNVNPDEVKPKEDKPIKNIIPQSTEGPIKEVGNKNLPKGIISGNKIPKQSPITSEDITKGLSALFGVKTKSENKEKSVHIDKLFRGKDEEVLEKISASNERINKLNEISDPLSEISGKNKPKLRGLYEDEKEVSNENREKVMGNNMKKARDNIAHVEDKEYLDIKTGKMGTETQNQESGAKAIFDTPVKKPQFYRLKGQQVNNNIDKTFDEIKVDKPKENSKGLSTTDKSYNANVDSAKEVVKDLASIVSSSKLYTNENPSLFDDNTGAITEIESKEHWKYEQADNVSEDDLAIHEQNAKGNPKHLIEKPEDYDPDFDKVLDYSDDTREETNRDAIDELVEAFDRTKDEIKELKESRKNAKQINSKELSKEFKKKIKDEKIAKKSIKKELKKAEKINRTIASNNDLDKFADLMKNDKPEENDNIGIGMGALTPDGKRKKPNKKNESFKIQKTSDRIIKDLDEFLKEHDNFTSNYESRKSRVLKRDIEDRHKHSKEENLFDDLVGDINGEDKKN